MSKDKISDYSQTANSNTDIGGINVDEGCAPSGINDAIRTLMKQLKDFQQGTNSDSFNGPVGATTASTGAFTTVTTTSTINGLTVGKGAGAVSTNTAVGASALQANTTGARNTVVGYQAAYSTTTGFEIDAFGAQALYSNTTGTENLSVGRNSSYANTTGTRNTVVGISSFSNNSTGSYNTSLGWQSLLNNTTASNNTAVGYQAGYSNTTGSYNTLVGYQAGYSISGSGNTLNTFVGQSAGYNITTGTKNTIIGTYNGNQNGFDGRTANSRVVVSDGDGYIRFFHDGGATGNLIPKIQSTSRMYGFDDEQFYPTPDNLLKLGNPSYRWTTVYATTGSINTSDVNAKQDIAELDAAEKRVAVAIKSLIKKYRFKDAVSEKGEAARIHVGAVAQEVQAAFVAEGLDPTRYALFCSDTWYEVDGKAAEPATPYTAETEGAVEVTRLGLRYEELLAFVIAAL